ncbi:hypothetical protein B0H14DRAFT_2614052 [Mycena olivaceomarginata]|nr:hypothetical protein B0H14DRAFT_2614052 [Mycena olivaceomarginata]
MAMIRSTKNDGRIRGRGNFFGPDGRPPSNRSVALDVARKGGIAPPTAALGAVHKSGILYTYGLQINPTCERADKTEAVACRNVDGPPSNRSAALDVARKGCAQRGAQERHFRTRERADKTEAVACRNVNRDPINRSAALDAACKNGISGVGRHGHPLTLPLPKSLRARVVRICRSGRRKGSSQSKGFAESSYGRGSSQIRREPELLQPEDLQGRCYQLDVARKEGIAPPTAALGAARKSGVSYAYEPPITYGPSIDSGGMSGRTRQKWWQGQCYQRKASSRVEQDQSTDDVGEREQERQVDPVSHSCAVVTRKAGGVLTLRYSALWSSGTRSPIGGLQGWYGR